MGAPWAWAGASSDPPPAQGLSGYDVVVVDTSPVLTPLNVAILYAVADILIPIDPCVAALAGVRALENLVQTVSEFRREFTDAGPLTIAGVLITRSDRTLVSKQIESEVRAYFGPLVYERVVPVSVKFREAYARGTPLIHYDRLGAGADAYRAAAQAYLNGGQPGGTDMPPTVVLPAVALPDDDDNPLLKADFLVRGPAWSGSYPDPRRARRVERPCRAGPGTVGHMEPAATLTGHNGPRTTNNGQINEQCDATRRDSGSREPDRPDPAEHDRGRVRAAGLAPRRRRPSPRA
jgi:hypothetical protein